MTAFAPGFGGSLKSTTVEAAFLELVVLASVAPRLENAPADAQIAYQFNSATNTIAGTMVIPIETSLTNGLITTNPVPFVDEAGYTTGTGGDLSSSGLIDNLVELAYRVNEIPAISENEVGGLDLSVNLDAKRITAAFTCPVTISVDAAGKPIFTAVDYLV
jgi:hypothetical protein